MKTHKRAIVIVLDSFGSGALPDANKFSDAGSNTLGHIDEYCAKNNLSFEIPNLLKLGLGRIYTAIHNQSLNCDNSNYLVHGAYAACKELSSGKDTTSGHWEIAGYPVLFEWGYFTNPQHSFPQQLLNKIIAKSGISGYLGNCHASGTEILRQLGDEHIKTNKPIFYTSADSVFQIACHEEHFGLDNLYKLCEIVRDELEPYNIARVIARPFIGNQPDNYERTGNRHDYSLTPASDTLFDICVNNGITTVAIGKIGDIYAHKNTQIELRANGLAQLVDTTINAMQEFKHNSTFIMTNLVDFDMLYGHRRDIVGYKKALEYFDSRIPELLANLNPDDILILTADHGCDPTWKGSDHTREYIPFLMYANGIELDMGIRETYADIGQTVAKHLQIPPLSFGVAAV
ncbi:MAG: phosphopentomutase [Burkholderiales bacterium]|nr:phosphopentomutase [Burkholderiales bacterium]